MSFELTYSKEALKNLKRIPARDLKKIKRKFDLLKQDPFTGAFLQGNLKGLRKLRVWPLRVVYQIDKTSKIIFIITVDYRGNVYKK